MSYQEYTTVVDGIGKQIDACLAALDQAQNGKKNPPKMLGELDNKLREAGEICGRIEAKAENEKTEHEDADKFGFK